MCAKLKQRDVQQRGSILCPRFLRGVALYAEAAVQCNTNATAVRLRRRPAYSCALTRALGCETSNGHGGARIGILTAGGRYFDRYVGLGWEAPYQFWFCIPAGRHLSFLRTNIVRLSLPPPR